MLAIQTEIVQGIYNNKELLIRVNGGIEAGLDQCGYWHKGRNDNELILRVPFVLPKDWLVRNARVIYNHVVQNPQDANALDEWRETARQIVQLPRVILPGGIKNGEGKRHLAFGLSAVCSIGDVRMKETLKGLGFKWSSQTRLWQLRSSHDKCQIAFKVLSHWNFPSESPNFDSIDINKLGRVPMSEEQEDSLRFLISRWEKGYHGGVNGDDMGIGKTYCSLLLGAAALELGIANKIVVLAKTSNLAHWKNEWAEKIANAGEGDVYILSAANLNATRKKENLDAIKTRMEQAKVILTNYECLRNDKNLAFLIDYADGAISFFDEALDMCGDHSSKTSAAAFSIAGISNFSVPLSGTLEKKNIYEFWSVLRLADPSIYPEHEFIDKHCVFERQSIWLKTQKRKVDIVKTEYKEEEEFHRIVGDAYVRHIKNISREQALKVEKHYCMSKTDAELECTIAHELWVHLCSIHNSGTTWEKLRAAGVRLPQWQMSALTHLHSALDDPYILFESESYLKLMEFINLVSAESNLSSKEILEQFKTDTAASDFTPDIIEFGKYLQKHNPDELRRYVPAKTRFIYELMENDFKDSRIVIFSTFRRTAVRLTEHLKERFPDREVFIISGDVDKAKRAEIEEQCRQTPRCVLVSTDSMAFGTNLQFMDALINYNLPWTSDVLKQRNDRIYRTGSKGIKNIIYLTVDSPVDEHKLKLLRTGIETVKSHFKEDTGEIPPAEIARFKSPSVMPVLKSEPAEAFETEALEFSLA